MIYSFLRHRLRTWSVERKGGGILLQSKVGLLSLSFMVLLSCIVTFQTMGSYMRAMAAMRLHRFVQTTKKR